MLFWDIDTILFVAGCDSGAFAHGKWCFCSRKVLFCALFFKRSSLILYLVLLFCSAAPRNTCLGSGFALAGPFRLAFSVLVSRVYCSLCPISGYYLLMDQVRLARWSARLGCRSSIYFMRNLHILVVESSGLDHSVLHLASLFCAFIVLYVTYLAIIC